jgi:uncharacterized protein (TIRG00374 family)
MNQQLKSWTKFILRWGIAVAGIYYVISSISLPDRVTVPSPKDGWPEALVVVGQPSDSSPTFQVRIDGSLIQVTRNDLLVRPDQERVYIQQDGKPHKLEVLALMVRDDDPDRSHWPLIVTEPRTLWQRYWKTHNGHAKVIQPSQILGSYDVNVPYPIVEIGMQRMLSEAKLSLLLLSIIIFPTTFVLTSIRWHRLLLALQISISLGRTFVLNMVGAFYNTFIPAGSTGGDLLKAYYAARQTHHATRAVLSVVVDRIIGLLALVILGGVMAASFYFFSQPHNTPAAIACRNVALGSLAIIGGTALALALLLPQPVRRLLGLDRLLERLPAQKHIRHVIEVASIYKRRPALIIWALLITFPVHITVIISTMLACKAFGLPLSPMYYFIVVPVVVLVGAIPISPQGAGVMEFFAILLTRQQGATISQAFALTMTVRLVQILWNLVGGIFVLRGGYHAPSQAEQRSLQDREESDETIPPPPAPPASHRPPRLTPTAEPPTA